MGQRRPAGAPPPPRSPRVFREWVFDVKTIHGGSTTYGSARARDEQCGGVLERAHHVSWEYLAHARRIDARLHTAAVAAATRAGQAAPPAMSAVVDRLATIAPVRPLVFGQYGEASPDVHEVLLLAAEEAGRRAWERLGARSEVEARAYFLHAFRRRVGVGVVRAFARHRIGRVSMVGATGGVLRGQGPRMQPRPEARAPFEFFAYQAYLPREIEV